MKKGPAPHIHIVTHECSSCGTVHRTGGGLPLGWSAVPANGLAWCTECTTGSIQSRMLKAGSIAA